MTKVTIFKGNDKKFSKFLIKEGIHSEKNFLDLIKEYDKLQIEGVSVEKKEEIIDTLIITASDFSSIKTHVISNFYNIVISSHKINNIYIQNPPIRIEKILKEYIGKENIKYIPLKYKLLTIDELKNNYHKIKNSARIIGQSKAKRQVFVNLYKNGMVRNSNPLVLMFYGKSGVGKTIFAKEIGKFYGDETTRLQFSMMQNEASMNYLYGTDNSKPSFAFDLLNRKSNVILIDEFDKANPIFYNLFYQMFDEGVFRDNNYEVDLANCIFILTSNFLSLDEISKRIGEPLYSRLDDKIKFEELSRSEYTILVKQIFKDIFSDLNLEQQTYIKNLNLEKRYLNSNNQISNNRLLKKLIENDIYTLLFDNEFNK